MARAERALDGGEALERFRRMVEAQGGDPRVVDDPHAVLPAAPVVLPIEADRDGTLAGMDAEAIGTASVALGAGRIRKGDPIDPAVGYRGALQDRRSSRGRASRSARCTRGSADDAAEAARRVLAAFTVTDGDVSPPPLVHRWIEERVVTCAQPPVRALPRGVAR